MSEEVKNASSVVPISMLWSITFSGVVGLAMYIALLFSISDLDAALSTSFTYPFIQILLDALNSVAGTAVMLMIMIIIDMALVMSCVAAASRMLWSFARDKGVPGWQWLRQVRQQFSYEHREHQIAYEFRSILKRRFLLVQSIQRP